MRWSVQNKMSIYLQYAKGPKLLNFTTVIVIIFQTDYLVNFWTLFWSGDTGIEFFIIFFYFLQVLLLEKLIGDRKVANVKKAGMSILGTVKPVLTTTYEQRPPVNNGQPEGSMTSLNLAYHWYFSDNPLHNGHVVQVLRVVVEHRFDCISDSSCISI